VISRRQRARKKGHAEIVESQERKQQERREEGRASEEGTNPFRKSSRTGRSEDPQVVEAKKEIKARK
jgi:hypothetical protein